MSEWDDYFEQLIDAVDNLRAVHFKVASKTRQIDQPARSDSLSISDVEYQLRDRLSAMEMENKRLLADNHHLQQQLEMMSVALDNQSTTIPPVVPPPDDVNGDLHFPDVSLPPQPSGGEPIDPIRSSLPEFKPLPPVDDAGMADSVQLPKPIAPKPEEHSQPESISVEDKAAPLPPAAASTDHPGQFEGVETATEGRFDSDVEDQASQDIADVHAMPSIQAKPVMVEAELESSNEQIQESLESPRMPSLKKELSPRAEPKNPVRREPIDYESQREIKGRIRDVQRRIRNIEADEGPRSKGIIAEITDFYKMYHQRESKITSALNTLDKRLEQETSPIANRYSAKRKKIVLERDEELEPLRVSLGSNETAEDIEAEYSNKRSALQSRLDKAISRLASIESSAPKGIKGFFTSNAKKLKNIDQMDLLKEEIDEIESQLRRTEGLYTDKLEKLKDMPTGEDAAEIQAALDARMQHYQELINQLNAEEKVEIDAVSGPYVGERRDIEELAAVQLDDLKSELEAQELSFIDRFARTLELKPLASELSDLENELDVMLN